MSVTYNISVCNKIRKSNISVVLYDISYSIFNDKEQLPKLWDKGSGTDYWLTSIIACRSITTEQETGQNSFVISDCRN